MASLSLLGTYGSVSCFHCSPAFKHWFMEFLPIHRALLTKSPHISRLCRYRLEIILPFLLCSTKIAVYYQLQYLYLALKEYYRERHFPPICHDKSYPRELFFGGCFGFRVQWGIVEGICKGVKTFRPPIVCVFNRAFYSKDGRCRSGND